jgi:hypothetical protein
MISLANLNRHSEKNPRTERLSLEPRFETARLTGKGSNYNPCASRAYSRRTTMYRKLTIALAAAASLSAAALAPTSVSAKPFGGFGGFHHHSFGGFGVVGAIAADAAEDNCFVTRRVLTPWGYRFRTVNVCAY